MLHRDMVPVMTAPTILTMEEIVERNSERKTRYLVPSDLVIGVEHNGESRAYPLSVLNVHEVVHDELGGEPILVSWHWPSASARAMVRHDRDQQFRVSGLVAGGNGLLYIPNDEPPVGGEPLYSQLLARAITGNPDRPSFETIPHQFTRWATGLDGIQSPRPSPRTPVSKQYKKSSPFTYYEHDDLMFPGLDLDGPPAVGDALDLDGHRARGPGLAADQRRALSPSVIVDQFEMTADWIDPGLRRDWINPWMPRTASGAPCRHCTGRWTKPFRTELAKRQPNEMS